MDTTTEKQQGTSPEILAPLLPYGIQIALLHHDGSDSGERAPLLGLSPHLRFPVACGSNPHYPMEVAWHGCLPCLYPFDAMTAKTEEHGVLLLKLAIILGWRAMGPFGMSLDHCYVYDNCETRTSGAFIINRADFESGNVNETARRALLSLHFAVGLEPHQYIPLQP